jgi:hypothetical protein
MWLYVVTPSLTGIGNYTARNLDFMNGLWVTIANTYYTRTAFRCIINITMLSFENPNITEMLT